MACATTGKVLSVVCAKGKKHDFSVFKESRLPIHPNSKLLADSGYQGLKNIMRTP
ncbi:MAG: transposase [Ghiorsea sp.]|nr:transposase [Ghiorsea sp.]MDQ7057277.1 transposase [Ghiorsea sp.]MDQ7059553.1 transposase [Ghiorsea sp.]MDQ7059564.1 transposase [Ghiorsea sp.]